MSKKLELMLRSACRLASHKAVLTLSLILTGIIRYSGVQTITRSTTTIWVCPICPTVTDAGVVVDGERRPPNNWASNFGGGLGSSWTWDEKTEEGPAKSHSGRRLLVLSARRPPPPLVVKLRPYTGNFDRSLAPSFFRRNGKRQRQSLIYACPYP